MSEIMIQRNSTSYGPYPAQVAKDYLRSGSLLADDQAVIVGQEGWKPLAELLAELDQSVITGGSGTIPVDIPPRKQIEQLAGKWGKYKKFENIGAILGLIFGALIFHPGNSYSLLGCLASSLCWKANGISGILFYVPFLVIFFILGWAAGRVLSAMTSQKNNN